MAQKYFENETFHGLSLSEGQAEGFTFVDCAFTGCTFENCRVAHCVFTECRFTGCHISGPKFENSQAKFLTLENCTLTGVNWGLLLPSGGFGQPLEKLDACRMKYSFFTEMDLRKFSFAGSSFQGCMFAGCNLAEGSLQGCDLSETEFFRCDLTGADFRGAVGYKVDVPSCTLKSASFSLPEAANLLYSLGIRLD